MNPKVLFISYDGMTDPLGQSQVLPYLTALSKRGYKITILSFEKKNRFAAEKKIIDEIVQQASITWVPQFFTSKPPLLSKMYDRWKMLRTARQLHQREKFDIIHCRSYISAEAGLRMKKSTGTRFLFDMRGFWADEKVDCGQWDQKKIFYRKLYRAYKAREKQFLLQADGIVSLTNAGRELLLSKPEYQHLSIDVIPCCADLDLFDFNKIPVSDTTALRAKMSIAPGKKVISYLGSIGGWYMTGEMFTFFKELLIKNPEFVLLILTKDDPARVTSEAAAFGVPAEKLFVHYAKRSEVPLYLSTCVASLFFIRPSFSKTASSPTKHAELMGMGIPVICNDIGDTGHIIANTGTGLTVESFSAKAYQDLIDKLPALLALPKEMIREAAFEYFDLAKGVEKYDRLYKRMLN